MKWPVMLFGVLMAGWLARRIFRAIVAGKVGLNDKIIDWKFHPLLFLGAIAVHLYILWMFMSGVRDVSCLR
jgi:hypothetical protein